MAQNHAALDETHGAPKQKSFFTSQTFIKALQSLAVLTVAVFLGLGVSVFIKNNVFRMIQIDGSSMVPTLAEHSKYLVNFWAMHNRPLKHNDIVVFRDPGDQGLSVKRVIAVEGESILIKEGKVYVNGEALKEEYLMSNVKTYTYSQAKEQFITLGQGQYFLLGDNRMVSIDSRSYGPVQRVDILGVVDTKHKYAI